MDADKFVPHQTRKRYNSLLLFHSYAVRQGTAVLLSYFKGLIISSLLNTIKPSCISSEKRIRVSAYKAVATIKLSQNEK